MKEMSSPTSIHYAPAPGRAVSVLENHVRSARTETAAMLAVLVAFMGSSLMLLTAPDRPETVLALVVGFIVALAIMRRPITGTYLAIVLTVFFDTLPSPYVRTLASDLGIFRPLNSRGLPDWATFSIFEVIIAVSLLSALAHRFVKHVKMERGPLYPAMMLFGAVVLLGEVNGVMTGGDFKLTLWELRPLLYLVALYLLAVNTIREPRHVRALLWITVITMGGRCLEGLFRYIIMPADVRDTASVLLEHDDSFFLVLALGLTFAAVLLRKHLDRRLVVTLYTMVPFLLFVVEANKRRAAFMCLFLVVATFLPMIWVTLSTHEQRRRMAYILVASAILLAGYTAAFWNSSNALAAPAQSIRSVIEPGERDAASNLYRVQENENLKYTINQSPFTGIGFGKPMSVIEPMVDLTAAWPLQYYMPHNNIFWLWMRMGVVGFAIFWIMIGVAVLLVMACVRLGANALHLLDPVGTIRQKKAAQKDLRTTTVFRYAAGNNEGSIVQFKRHRAQVLTPREIGNAAQRREWAEFLLLIFMAQATLTCLLSIGVVDQGLMSDRLMAYSGLVLGTLTACWGIYNTRYRKQFVTELAKLSAEEGATPLEDAQPEKTEKETANASR